MANSPANSLPKKALSTMENSPKKPPSELPLSVVVYIPFSPPGAGLQTSDCSLLFKD